METYALDARRGVVPNPVGPSEGLDPRSGGQATRVIRGGSFSAAIRIVGAIA